MSTRGKIDVKGLLTDDTNQPYSSPIEANRARRELYGISDQYIVLDSFAKLRESNISAGEYKWNFMVQGSTGDEVVGVRDIIDNVIEIQMSSFAIPNLEEVPYVLNGTVFPNADTLVLNQNNTVAAAPFSPQLAWSQYPPVGPWQWPPSTPWINNPYGQLPFFGRMTIQLKEAGLQSFSGRFGTRHHFEFTTKLDGNHHNGLLAYPQSQEKWDTFVFTDPLKDVHGLTLVFRNPDHPIRFLPDCFYDCTIENNGLNVLRINAPGHNLLMGDRIFITGCKSGNNILDSYINRVEGHVAAGNPALPFLAPSVIIPDANYFYLDPSINLSGLLVTAPVLPQTITVYVAKRRLRIPIRLRRVVGRLTNYIIP